MRNGLVAVGMALWLVSSCGGEPLPSEDTELHQEAITGGQVDPGFPAVGCLKTTSDSDRCGCTGTLIAPNLVLSAKHCGAKAVFQLGTSFNSPTHIRTIDRRIRHYPDDSSEYTHDVQVYHLSSPIYDVRPLSINTSAIPGNGKACMIVGWGAGIASGVRKRSATVNVAWSGEVTTTIFGLGPTLIASAIRIVKGSSSASPPGGMAEPGDSGGPLFCDGAIAAIGTGSTEPGGGGDMYYTALDSTRTLSSSWVTNVASNFVNEPMVAAASWNPNTQFDLFGRGTNGGLHHKAWTGSRWDPSPFGWNALGGFITGTPEAVSWQPGRVSAFVRGGDSNPGSDDVNTMSLWHVYKDGSNWIWQNLGGVLVSHPTAVSWGTNRVDVFGVGKDGRLHHQGGNNTGFLGWEAVPTTGGPTTFLGPMKAISTAPETLDLYAVGTDNMLYRMRYYIQHVWIWIPQIGQYVSGGSFPVWNGWMNLGGPVEGTPAVTTWGGGRQDIFVKKTDNRMYQKALVNNTWFPSQSEFYDLGGPIDGSPTAASMQTDWLTIVSNAPNNAKTDKQVYKAWFNGSQWYPNNTTWISFGGMPAGVPTLLATPGVVGVQWFSVGSSFGPGMSTYLPNGPAATHGWSGIASIGGTLSW